MAEHTFDTPSLSLRLRTWLPAIVSSQGMPDCPLLVPAEDTLVHGRESLQFYVGGSSAGGRTPRPRNRAAALRGLLFFSFAVAVHDPVLGNRPQEPTTSG
ncbi:hypothetical protein B0H14DRAFT_3488547 [Mycena olivaceomarginata]|nr:hypothetical protein B0H14DRAFT_3488547 [Mycena olivaceomarginata]